MKPSKTPLARLLLAAIALEGLSCSRPDPLSLGFRNVLINPDMVTDLTYASGSYRSLYGLIRSEWKRENSRLTLEIEIPANTTATVYLPASGPEKVSEGNKPVTGRSEFRKVKTEDGKTIIKTGSGHYLFTNSL